MKTESFFLLGFAMVIVGFVLVILGGLRSGNASTGAVILIGPFPIIFVSVPNGSLLALMSLVAGISVMLLFYLSKYWRR